MPSGDYSEETTLTSPITRRIGYVFVPVKNMPRAARWYSRLLDLPEREASHGGTIYDLPLDGETNIILDATKPRVVNSSQPLFFLFTEDIGATRTFLRQLGAEVVRDVEDIGSVFTLIFRDPDHNLLMVCQTKTS